MPEDHKLPYNERVRASRDTTVEYLLDRAKTRAEVGDLNELLLISQVTRNLLDLSL